ncbi:hypothetical protein [Sodalis praecaptivus]|uniref:hypothetical protein n=1 Tax=Sodalis praecaptivus TaxID=1239307 RepID=UPI00280B903F|nr:hypothetical protein [Sodalis praecaptivus]
MMFVKRMMFRWMHRHDGEGISDTARLRQSAFDILQTPAGSRVMRRDDGSTLFTLIDQP